MIVDIQLKRKALTPHNVMFRWRSISSQHESEGAHLPKCRECNPHFRRLIQSSGARGHFCVILNSSRYQLPPERTVQSKAESTTNTTAAVTPIRRRKADFTVKQTTGMFAFVWNSAQLFHRQLTHGRPAGGKSHIILFWKCLCRIIAALRLFQMCCYRRHGSLCGSPGMPLIPSLRPFTTARITTESNKIPLSALLAFRVT